MKVIVLFSPNSTPQGKREYIVCDGADSEEGLTHLVVAQPDAPLCNAEAEYMVSERFALGVPLGRGKRLCQHLLEQLVVRLLIKCLHMHSAALASVVRSTTR